jgi:hypothetical protein
MPDYLPRSDIEFDQWMQNFTNYVVANATQLGVSTMEKSSLVARNSDWGNKYQSHILAKAAAHGATEMKDNERDSAEEFVRRLVKRITSYSNTNDADREAMGITVPDTEPTPIPEDVVINTPTPIVVVDHSQKKTAIVHFGANPQNENQNAKPNGIAGARIWYHIGGLPAAGEDWSFLADDTNSPYTHNVGNDATMTIAYRAQWFDRECGWDLLATR